MSVTVTIEGRLVTGFHLHRKKEDIWHAHGAPPESQEGGWQSRSANEIALRPCAEIPSAGAASDPSAVAPRRQRFSPCGSTARRSGRAKRAQGGLQGRAHAYTGAAGAEASYHSCYHYIPTNTNTTATSTATAATATTTATITATIATTATTHGLTYRGATPSGIRRASRRRLRRAPDRAPDT